MARVAHTVGARRFDVTPGIIFLFAVLFFLSVAPLVAFGGAVLFLAAFFAVAHSLSERYWGDRAALGRVSACRGRSPARS